MFTSFDKAVAAPVGVWIATGLATLSSKFLELPMDANTEAWFATVVSALLVWAIPNRRV